MKEYPRLMRQNNKTTLISDEKPYLIFGGEAHNSSSSDLAYMEREVWPRIRSLHLNTLLLPVTWELFEPEAGRFDYTLPDGLIAQAESEGVKLVFLWFGLWKNGASTYAPAWVKADTATYFHMRDRFGKPIDAVSPLCDAAVERDAVAFSALLAHLRDYDANRTVLMVQVENEMGLLGDCRDFGESSERAYNAALPKEVAALYDISGTWREAFGTEAPERFMTYCYAKAVERIAFAGKSAYPIPLYVNAWLEQYPWIPGTYPVGGPIARHMDMWKLLAPSIDFLAPDIYLPDFERVCSEYTAHGNALFIPEARPCMDSSANVFAAFGRFGALGFSPFAIEDLCGNAPMPDAAALKQLNIMEEAFNIYRSGEFLAKSYALLRDMSGIIEEFRCTPRMQGFSQYREEGTLLSFERCDFLVRYARLEADKPKSGGLVIELAEDEYLLCGMRFQAQPLQKNDDPGTVEILSITEGRYGDNVWLPERRLNGDEMRLAFGDASTVLKCRLIRKNAP